MITPGMKRRLKRRFNAEKSTVNVGKDGATAEVIKEISRQLEQNEFLKAKILQTALSELKAEEIAATIAAQTGSTVVELRGHTFMLYRKRKRKQA